MKDSIYIRKIAASLFAVAVFATSASFSPAGTVKTESDNKVILQGNDGEEIEAEELSASDNETFAADESDVEDIVAQSKIAAAEFEAKNDVRITIVFVNEGTSPLSSFVSASKYSVSSSPSGGTPKV